MERADHAEAAEPIRVPGYRVCERLGAGGFGEVFRARRDVIDREVAIKVLHARWTSNADAVARFMLEARAVNKVSHPNIVEIFDFGQLSDGRHYCVMELVRGRTLRDVLRESTRLPLAEALPLLRGIAEAVDAAHAAGIAHRDLKPENVFVVEGGGIKLIDFGLAKLTTELDAPATQTGAVFGTPLYMSPEQCRSRGVGLASDRYSFGALAYHVLTGQPPFSGEPLELALKHLHDDPTPPSRLATDLLPRVDAAILSLLAKDPAERPASAVIAVEAMEGARTLPVRRRVRPWHLATAAVGLAAVTSAAFLLVRSGDSPRRVVAPRMWSQRELGILIDGTTENSVLSPDGERVVYHDESGWWRYEIANGHVEALRIPARGVDRVAPLDDGRLIVGDGETIETSIIDPRTGSTTPLLAAKLPGLSHDQRFVAAWDADGWLVVHELATGTTRRLYRVTNGYAENAPKWSPDGTTILWGRRSYDPSIDVDAHTFLTRVSDGETRPLTGPSQIRFQRVTQDYFDPIEILPDGRLAYCSEPPVEVRARSIDGSGETVLASLGAGVAECNLSRRGNRLLVTIAYSTPTVGVIALDRPTGEVPTLRNVATATPLRGVEADDRSIYAFVAPSRPRRNVDPPDEGSSSIVSIDIETGNRRPLPTCRDAADLVRRGEELLQVRYERSAAAETLQLVDSACSVREAWTFPAGTQLSRPRCGATWCSILGAIGNDVVLWRLEHGASPRELTRVPRPGSLPKLSHAHAPDDRTIVVRVGQNQLFLVPADGGHRIDLPFSGQLDGLAWGADPERFFVTGQWVDGARYALLAVTRDGARQILWSSKDTFLPRIWASRAGTLVVTDVAAWHQKFVLLEP